MGLLNRAQQIVGEKEFTHSATFDKDVVFKQHITGYSPVPSEPSLGTPHPTSDANRSATPVVSTSTNTAGVWSAAVTMTGVPVGAKAAYCLCQISKVAATPFMSVEAATGYTLSDITVGTNSYKYHGCQAGIAGGAENLIVKIHLDANKQFKWCTSQTNSTVAIGSAIDYDS